MLNFIMIGPLEMSEIMPCIRQSRHSTDPTEDMAIKTMVQNTTKNLLQMDK